MTTRFMLVLSVFALLALATAAPADIKNTAHNFGNFGWSDGEVCKPCHTPHNAVQGDPNPGVNHILWNHYITQETFTLFDGTQTTLKTWSKLCLSCHDGVTAMDAFGGKTTGNTTISPLKSLGTDLRDDHPVSVEYKELWHTPISALPSRIELFEDPDNAGQLNIECSTCHAPHGRPGIAHMLQIDNDKSALCFACHATR